MHDLVVRGGTVVDGTGVASRTADVAVTDGLVAEVGRVDGSAGPLPGALLRGAR
jgi:N-acyl-D-amino-acid deacylase